MNASPEGKRIRSVYENRKKHTDSVRYDDLDPAYRFEMDRRSEGIKKMLAEAGVTRADTLRVLDAGCGKGQGMADLCRIGFSEKELTGTDLLEDRLVLAKNRLRSASYVCADIRRLPFPSGTFSLVFTATVFSSILDASLRREAAREIVRTVRPGGYILWYDFLWNPLNPQTRGIGLREVQNLFQGLEVRGRRVTLAPPLTRFFIRSFPEVCRILDKAEFLKTHYLALIGPR